jgi:Xaa-Pro aminopeptidase
LTSCTARKPRHLNRAPVRAECGAVDAAARKVIHDSGYGPDYKYFAHRLGHGMGMDGTSGLIWFAATQPNLEPNMTTSNEPGIYIRGEFGIRLEDDMHITEMRRGIVHASKPVAGGPVR